MTMKDNATNLFGVPPRPQGTIGQKIMVRANMFRIKYKTASQWHHYDGKKYLKFRDACTEDFVCAAVIIEIGMSIAYNRSHSTQVELLMLAYHTGGVVKDFAPQRNREIIDELQTKEAATFKPRGVYDGRKNFFSIDPYSFHPMGEVYILYLYFALRFSLLML
jgi:hypothetical protein